MTDFQPIPGVWYRDGEIPEGQGPHLLYCPDGPDDSLPWMVGLGRAWLTKDKAPKNLVEVSNPHPPTCTEWALIADSPIGEFATDWWAHRETAQQQWDEDFPWVKVRPRWFRREVTEWVEVDEKETGQ